MKFDRLRLFIPDTVHFHDRNFKSLMDFITRHNIAVTKNEDINSWAGLYGDYSTKLECLKPYLLIISKVGKQDYFNFKYKSKNIWNIARAELLTWFLPVVEFNINVKERNDEKHILLMMKINKKVIDNCFAATMYFLDYWERKLLDIRVQTHALIFSGSQIYNRTLLETLKHSQTTPIVMEHFFTGNEYYFEERYTPIANSSDLRHAYYKSEKTFDYDRLRIKAINKVLMLNNRNVKKDGAFQNFTFPEGKTIGLIGQVVNDYSIIETASNYLNSVDFYKEFISKATANGINVIFKSHPWEKHKNNVRSSFTKEMLAFWSNDELTDKQRSRLVITDSVDIECLFKQVDYVAGLCSQGLLEACFDGFKSVQFGNAFFAGRGFTHDYFIVDDFVSDLINGKVNGYLNITEYSKFEDFLVESLERQLVSVHKSGILSLENKFLAYPLIPLVEKECLVVNNQVRIDVNAKVYVLSDIERKLIKLKKDPKSFFKDSRFKFLREVSRVI